MYLFLHNYYAHLSFVHIIHFESNFITRNNLSIWEFIICLSSKRSFSCKWHVFNQKSIKHNTGGLFNPRTERNFKNMKKKKIKNGIIIYTHGLRFRHCQICADNKRKPGFGSLRSILGALSPRALFYAAYVIRAHRKSRAVKQAQAGNSNPLPPSVHSRVHFI